jgi:hypothetical protein
MWALWRPGSVGSACIRLMGEANTFVHAEDPHPRERVLKRKQHIDLFARNRIAHADEGIIFDLL